MQSTNQISETIHQIFKIINVVYDPTIISFDDQQVIVAKFKHSLELASKIDISNVGKEVWDASNDLLKYNSIVEIVNDKFDLLLTWKPNIYDILVLKESLQLDLNSYFDKLKHLEIEINLDFKERISNLYIRIGLHFLKIKIDLDRMMNELDKKSEILENESLEKINKAAGYNIKLTPSKTDKFSRLILKMYFDNFFCPLDNVNEITEIDVLMAFEKFFDINILDSDWFKSDEYLDYIIAEKFQNNSVSKPIITEDELATQLKSFFTNAAGTYLINNLPIEFKIEFGKSMAILIYVLKNYQPCLLTIPYRKNKMFHEIFKAHFKRDIGTYQSIFNCKVDSFHDKDDIEHLKNRIDLLYQISKALN